MCGLLNEIVFMLAMYLFFISISILIDLLAPGSSVRTVSCKLKFMLFCSCKKGKLQCLEGCASFDSAKSTRMHKTRNNRIHHRIS